MDSFELHPLSLYVPPLTLEERAAFHAEIVEKGLREPIVLLEGRVLTDADRYRTVVDAGLAFTTYDFDPMTDGEPTVFVHASTRDRNLTVGQRAALVLRLEDWAHQRDAARRIKTAGELAQSYGVSMRALQRTRHLRRHAEPTLLDAVANGALTLNEALQYAQCPHETQWRVAQASTRSERLCIAGVSRLVGGLTQLGFNSPTVSH